MERDFAFSFGRLEPDFCLHHQQRQSQIRARRAVADVSSDGGHITDLHASKVFGRFHKHRIVFPEFRILDDIANCHQSSYSGDFTGINTIESRNGPERNQRLRMDFAVFDPQQHICPPCYEQRIRYLFFKLPGFSKRERLVVFILFHATTFRSLSEAISEEDRPTSARMVSVCSPKAGAKGRLLLICSR